MSEPCTVLLSASDLLEPLKERAAIKGELFTFSSADALLALETITTRRPRSVVMERAFAATPRGTALIHRIRADPKLADCEIRVLAHDSDYSRVVPRTPTTGPPTLDQRGTRRAPRFKIAEQVTVLVDGKAAVLLDLSAIGAQVLSSVVLKPNQRVQVGLKDQYIDVRFNGSVAWTSFETSPSGARYRGGIAFEDGDAPVVGAFCVRHKA